MTIEPVVVQPWSDAALTATERVQSLLDRLSLEEKIAQLGSHWDDRRNADEIIAPMQDVFSAGRASFEKVTEHGIGHLTRVLGTHPAPAPEGARRLADAQRAVRSRSRFGIPAIAHEECLTGFTTLGATVYPTPLAVAATFDPALVVEMGSAIGSDLRSVGVHQGLAPVLDVVRDYRWGRVEETFGEDPYLVSVMGTGYVQGLERAGVVATLKHFAGYAASRGGRNHAPVSIGARELADVVLPPFEMAVRVGGARSVMNAYTDLDGVPSAADQELLTRTLRDQWGFTGTVVSDYWAVAFLKSKHRVAASMRQAGVLSLSAGLDVELPDTAAFSELSAAVAAGELDVDVIDRAVERVLRQKLQLGLLDEDWSPEVEAGSIDLDSPRNRSIARRLAEESVILLANDRAVLPLPVGAGQSARLAVIGPCADDVRAFLGCYSYPIHVLPRHPEFGFGLAIQSIPEALAQALPGTTISTSVGCALADDDRSLFDDALHTAAAADVVIAVVGDRAGMFGRGTSGEGSDAADLELPGVQGELLDVLLDAAEAGGPPVIVLVVSGRPYALGRHAGRAAAVVQAFMPGVEGARAIAEVLTGVVNPSGKLPVQVPRTSAALPHTYLAPPLGRDGDRISNLAIAPLYPFGHGLSYTSFEFGGFEIDSPTIRTDGTLEVGLTVTNTGDRPGATVAQLYFSDPVARVARPVIQLVGFVRVVLAAGESARVVFRVAADRFAYTERAGRRIVESGVIELLAGSSSGDLPLSSSVLLAGDTRTVGADRVLTTESAIVRKGLPS